MSKFFLIPIDFSTKNKEHVYLLQQALITILDRTIDNTEITTNTYGDSTKLALTEYQETRKLPLVNVNVPLDTINAINSELQNRYRICGSVTNSYGTPLEKIKVTIDRVFYSKKQVYPLDNTNIATLTLADGSFRSYVCIDESGIGTDGLLKEKLCVVIKLYEEGNSTDPIFTSGLLIVNDLESIFNFSFFSLMAEAKDLTAETKYSYFKNTLFNNGIEIDKDDLESAEQSQIKEISTYTGIETDIIMKLLVARALSTESKFFHKIGYINEKIKTEFIFGYLYLNYPTNMPLTLYPDEIVSNWKSYKDDLKDVVYAGLVLMPENMLSQVLLSAVNLSYIGNLGNDALQNMVSIIRHKFQDVSCNFPLLEGGVSLETVINLVETVKLDGNGKQSIAELFVANMSDFDKFIEALQNSNDYYADDIAKLVLCFQVSRVVRNFTKMITKVLSHFEEKLKNSGIKFLASVPLDKEGEHGSSWAHIVDSTGAPSGFTKDEYAELIYNTAQTLYPDISTLSQLEALNNDEFPRDVLNSIKTAIYKFPTNNMLYSTAEGYKLSGKAEEAFNKIQRIYSISPNPKVATKLLENNFMSAGDIYLKGKRQLEQRFKEDLTQEEINSAFNMATARFSNALSAYTNLDLMLNQNPSLIEQYDYETIKRKLREDFPNIETLFGNLDYCDCPHDSSVYSSAAYLADLLTYLDARDSQPNSNVSVKHILDERRADISKIYLNERNTNTTLPYIDLVCEVLEEAILKAEVNSGYSRNIANYQSTLSSQELLAAPEHILSTKSTDDNIEKTAYDVVKNKIFPMYASLDLWQLQARVFLKEVDINRYDLMKAYQSNISDVKAPTDEAIAAEFFELTKLDYNVIVANSTSTITVRNEAWQALEKVGGIYKITSDKFKSDTNLSAYKVIDLLKANWIGISSQGYTSDCTDKGKHIEGSVNNFDRAHRFVRLWYKSDWKIWELNLLLRSSLLNYVSPSADNLNADALIKLMAFKQQQDTLKISTDKLLAVYGDINVQSTYEETKEVYSLYDRVFLRTVLSNPLNEHLLAIKKRRKVSLAPEDESLIASCLGISQSDYLLLKGNQSVVEVELPYISFLYRHAIMAQHLKISISDLMLLIKLNDITPSVSYVYQPDNVDKIIETLQAIRNSNLTMVEYDYLINYYDYDSANPNPNPDTSINLTKNILTGYVDRLKPIVLNFSYLKPPEDHEIKGEPGSFTAASEYTDYFANYLLKHNKFSSIEDINGLVAIIECRSNKDEEGINQFIEKFLPSILGFELGNDLHSKEIDKKEQLIERYNSVCSYMNQTILAIDVLNVLSEFSTIGIDKTMAYVQFADSTATTLIGDFINENYYTGTSSEIYERLILLHKASYIILKNNITLADFDDLLNLRTNIFDWFKFRNAASGTFVSLNDLLKLLSFLSLNNLYGTTAEGDNILSLINKTSSITVEFKRILCLLANWSLEEFNNLISNKILDITSINTFYLSATYDRIDKCFAISSAANENVATVNEWRSRDTGQDRSIAEKIQNAVKSKYDIFAWLNKLQTIQRPIRELKCNAISSFLIAYSIRQKNTLWETRHDLYSYFLLDTEMTALMKTSRIVQATLSVQLFVQRCFLNLEKDVVVDDKYDGEWNQWEWMKKYRLWEANRKIFLYPENWIEPDLRDDKTPIFKELEDDLNQNEITNEYAEEVFENYLQKLNDISNLFICGMYREHTNFDDGFTNTDTDMQEETSRVDTLHIIARSKSIPYTYYYRKYNALDGVWSHWTNVDLDIKGDVVVPFVYNRRLHLFWLSNVERTNNNSSHDNAVAPDSYVETQLGWSVLRNKKWTKVQYSTKKILQNGIKPISDYSLIARYIDDKNEIEFDVFMHNMDSVSDGKSNCFYSGIFYFNGNVYKSAVNIYDNQNMYLKTSIDKMDKNIKPDIANIASTEYGEYNRWSISSFIASRLYQLTPSYDRGTDNRENVYVHSLSPANDYNDRKKLISTDKKGPNLVQAVHNASDFWHSMFSTHEDIPFFYQDSERSFLVTRKSIDDVSKYEFQPFYHPYVKLFIQELNRLGLKGLMNRNIQINPRNYYPHNNYCFNSEYIPEVADNIAYVLNKYEQDIVDFDLQDAYSVYNWELFFHTPLLIACKLSQNQKFEEAMKWFHSIFNPSDKSNGLSPQKYWITKPFYKITTTENREEEIRNILTNIQTHAAEVNAWLNDPYKPHLVARTRPVAYQRTIVMKYIDNLIAWADQLFRQDTMESNNEATFLYILAYEILGKRPIIFPKKQEGVTNINYNYIKSRSNQFDAINLFDASFKYDSSFDKNDTLLSFVRQEIMNDAHFERGSNYSISEQIIKVPQIKTTDNKKTLPSKNISLDDSLKQYVQRQRIFVPFLQQVDSTPSLPRIDATNFCVPFNEELFRYWDTAEDRLFKLRNSMNIEGVVRELPLFEPPIDPALLVKAAASGLSTAEALNDISAPQPYYRFRVILQKAVEFASEVKQLGDKLLSALEKRDAETLSLLRNSQEMAMQAAIKQIRKLQIDEAKENLENINILIGTAEAKKEYYSTREEISSLEAASFGLSISAGAMDSGIAISKMIASAAELAPDVTVGGAGAMGAPLAVSSIAGGEKVSGSINYNSNGLSILAGMLDRTSSLLSTKAGYQRRKEDWDFQVKMADMELLQLQRQLTAAEIRLMVAEKEIENLELQIEQSQSVQDYYKTKYTNEDLYNWMITQISSVYFQSYQLAYDMSKKAEQCYRHELGIYDYDTSFINFGYWDSLRKGLLSGDKLIQDLHRLDAEYINKNKRDMELTKHISLAQMFPAKLFELLQTNHETTLELPELIFDMDYPGHYMRRIKSVSITIPNVAGSYTTISFMLTLQNAKVRKSAILNSGDPETSYPESPLNADSRFVYQTGGNQSICTSSAQNDSGMFELNFNDERYLPFEGAGVISTWKLFLPAGCNQFDLSTISDVILHINYTSRYDGALVTAAKPYLQSNLPNAGSIFSLKQDFPDSWATMNAGAINNQMAIDVKDGHLPFFLQGTANINIENIAIAVSSKVSTQNASITFKKNNVSVATLNLSMADIGGGIYLYTGVMLTTNVAAKGEWVVEINGIKPSVIEDATVGFSLKRQ